MASGRPESAQKAAQADVNGSTMDHAYGLNPGHKDHVWSYDFVADRTSNGKPLRMLNVIDEYTRECLAIRIDRKITSNDVVEALAELFVTREIPTPVIPIFPELDRYYCTRQAIHLTERGIHPYG